jgi:hypothetical protein
MIHSKIANRIAAVVLCLSVVAFFVCSGIANSRGESQANLLCASIHPGESAASARAKMQASPAFIKYLDHEPERLSVEFKAAWVERYACIATISQGKVVQTSVFHDD